MPYRTAATTGIDGQVLCAACAKPYAVALGAPARKDETFRCRGCGVEQLVLRDGDDDAALTVAAHVPAKYTELADLARLLGAREDVLSLDVLCAGLLVEVALSINSGNVEGVDLTVKVGGGGPLPPVQFVAESAAHADAKRRRIAREVQTGDDSFDASVYIESDAADADVLCVLSAPAVRRAVARLLELGAKAVKLEAARVSISVKRDGDGVLDGATMAERVRLLRTIVGCPRPLALQPVARRTPMLLAAQIGAWTAVPIGGLALIAGVAAFEPMEPSIYFVGFPAGLAAGVLVQPLLTRAVRGRSTSQRDLVALRAPAIGGVTLLVAGLLVLVNGAFDRSPERVVEMEIVHTNVDSDDKDVTRAECMDPHFRTHSYPFKVGAEPITQAYYVRTRWRSGALGVPWESGTAVLTDSPHQTTPR